MRERYDYLVVGSGCTGCTVAERLAVGLKKKIFVVEKRSHIGGNAYDRLNHDGIMIQLYGPHIFHTKLKHVWEYLSNFTAWNGYIHQVLAHVHGMEVPFPICIETMEMLHGRHYSLDEIVSYFEKVKIAVPEISTARDVIVSQTGEEVYELFFKNYTKKQWGVYPEELSADVTRRIPIRFNRDTRYFDDPYQGIPAEGYTRMFERMLKHPNITVLTDTDYRDVISDISFDRMVYTGPIDSFFDFVHGELPYRSLRFKFETHDIERFQQAAVINYPNEHDYTRVTEFKQLYLHRHEKTTICYEYPQAAGEPYYPIPKQENTVLYEQYDKEAHKLGTVFFVGRLAKYEYLNMDQAISAALELVGGIG